MDKSEVSIERKVKHKQENQTDNFINKSPKKKGIKVKRNEKKTTRLSERIKSLHSSNKIQGKINSTQPESNNLFKKR